MFCLDPLPVEMFIVWTACRGRVLIGCVQLMSTGVRWNPRHQTPHKCLSGQVVKCPKYTPSSLPTPPMPIPPSASVFSPRGNSLLGQRQVDVVSDNALQANDFSTSDVIVTFTRRWTAPPRSVTAHRLHRCRPQPVNTISSHLSLNYSSDCGQKVRTLEKLADHLLSLGW